MKNYANASAPLNHALMTSQADTSLTKKSVSANATSRFKDVMRMKSTTLISASVFVPKKTVGQTNSGARKIANVSANHRSVLRVHTGESIWRAQKTVAASASITYVHWTTIGMRHFAIAFAPHKNALKTFTGTVSSADADALLLTAVMRMFIQSTTLKLALAFVLRTHLPLAMMTIISTMSLANAFVRQKNARTTNTGTPEFVVASQNTAVAQLVNISTLIH